MTIGRVGSRPSSTRFSCPTMRPARSGCVASTPVSMTRCERLRRATSRERRRHASGRDCAAACDRDRAVEYRQRSERLQRLRGFDAGVASQACRSSSRLGRPAASRRRRNARRADRSATQTFRAGRARRRSPSPCCESPANRGVGGARVGTHARARTRRRRRRFVANRDEDVA